MLNNQVTLVTLPGAGTAITAQVSTNQLLACSSAYPTVTFYVTRNSNHLSPGVIQTTSGTLFGIQTLSFNGFITGDIVYAQITTAGSGCTNCADPFYLALSRLPIVLTQDKL